MSVQEYTTDQFFPTEPWLQTYQEEINSDDTYQEASEGWGVDFDGAFIFHISDIPLAEQTVADLPDELIELIDKRFDDLSDDEIAEIVAAASEDVRSDIEAREENVSKAIYNELLTVSLDDISTWLWPELEKAVPPLLVDLINQVDQYIVEGDTVYAYLDIYDSRCRDVDVVEDIEKREHGFIIHGEYDDWKDLVNGDAGIIDQLMGGIMELDGDMQKILQYSDAAVRLTDIAADTESRFLF